MKSFTVFAVVMAVLVGCAAENPILRKSEWDRKIANKPDPGSLQFALPRARLTIPHTERTETFKAGRFTGLVEACLYGMPNNIPKKFCDDLHRMGLGESGRLSVQPRFKSVSCLGSDTANNETRVSIAIADLTSASVPDPSQVFVIPLKRNYFQTSDIQLKLNPLGTIKSGVLKTDNLGATETLTAITSLVSTFATRQGLFQKSSKRTAANATDPLVKEAAVLLAVLKDKTKLEAKGWQAEILRSEFLGTLTETSVTKTTLWIPMPGSTRYTLAQFDACGTGNATTDVVIRVDQIQEMDAEPTESSAKTPSAEASKAGTLGWPYRVSKEMRVVSATCDSSCTDIKAQLIRLPQFGTVHRLPAKTGGKSSSIAPTYYDDGSIDELKIINTGESPSPIVDALKAALTPAPAVTEKTELESLTELIEARQALCRIVRKVDENDPICQGANPPTSL